MMRQWQAVRLMTALLVVVVAGMAAPGLAAPQAHIVIDARNGAVIEASNADQRLHPASLTKMMTLYMAFEAVRDGRLRLDQSVPVSRHAARQPPSKIGLRAGSRARVRDLIRAAAVRSANDSAVALAEAIGGTEARFAEMMTQRARELGMTATTFKNASGLTATGHLSTASDMALLGRRLLFDFPQYYNLFGREHTQAFGRRINNTNRLLRTHSGTDGIKTGYTRAAGYNLVASAKRGQRRVIVAVFGGPTAGARDAKVARLLDAGIAETPARVAIVPPATVTRRSRNGLALMAPLPSPRGGETVETLIASLEPSTEPEVAEGAESTGESTLLAMLPPAAPNRPESPTGWVVELGRFPSETTAAVHLENAPLDRVPGLAAATKAVVAAFDDDPRFAARLVGLDGLTALTACAVLGADGGTCTPIPPAMR